MNKKYSHNGFYDGDPAVKKQNYLIVLGALKSNLKSSVDDLNEQLSNGQINIEEYKTQFSVLIFEFKHNKKQAFSQYKGSFKRKSFVNVNPVEFNNSIVLGSNFSQTEPFTDVFPADIENVTFKNCNLNNCNIPDGAIIEGGVNDHFEEQEDHDLWVVDENRKPIRPLHPKIFDNAGITKDPNRIRENKNGVPVTMRKKLSTRKTISEFRQNPEKLKQLLTQAGEINGN